MRRAFRRIGPAMWFASLILVLQPLAAAAQEGATPDSVRGVAAAVAWLEMLDAGQVQATFDSAAPLLRTMAASPARWREFVATARDRFPRTPLRTLAAADLAPALPGAPPGRYARFVFRTAITDAVATETVVVQLVDGRWRVAMYGVTGA